MYKDITGTFNESLFRLIDEYNSVYNCDNKQKNDYGTHGIQGNAFFFFYLSFFKFLYLFFSPGAIVYNLLSIKKKSYEKIINW